MLAKHVQIPVRDLHEAILLGIMAGSPPSFAAEVMGEGVAVGEDGAVGVGEQPA
jgi:hypothetical protein